MLLIAGGGTLGTYVGDELLRLGHRVDVICLEDKVSNNENLRFFKKNATLEYLEEFLKDNYYDGIVNFLHYPVAEEYYLYHKLLTRNTDHLIFLSSYRTYADKEHPITETSPQLLDVVDDPKFLAEEDYALPKTRCERWMKNESGTKNWTVVRPVISFSDKRLDIVSVFVGEELKKFVNAGKTGEVICLPVEAKNNTAGVDWAGNSGKLIAHLLFKEETFGEAYTISTAPNLKWHEVAEIYTELLGIKFEWVKHEHPEGIWSWHHDRAYDRSIDATKVMKATGLTKDDFKSVREGVIIELKNLGAL